MIIGLGDGVAYNTRRDDITASGDTDGTAAPVDPAQCAECKRWIGPDDGRGGPRDQEHEPGCMSAVAAPAAYQVRTFLDITTGHLPKRICERLGSYEAVVAYETTWGWFMWVPQDPDDPDNTAGVPAEVLAVQRYARRYGCDYVLFDSDAETVEGLPVWDW